MCSGRHGEKEVSSVGIGSWLSYIAKALLCWVGAVTSASSVMMMMLHIAGMAMTKAPVLSRWLTWWQTISMVAAIPSDVLWIIRA